MHFVDDVDFVFADCRRELHAFFQIADFVHAVVACGVHFDNIDVGALESFAYLTFSARGAVYRVQTVYRSCEYLCRTCFARSARAREEVRMPYGAGFDLVDERLDDVLLTYDLIPGSGAVFAI